MTLLAPAALLLTVASLMVVGGALFALFVFFPLFLLVVAGVLARLDDRSVRPHNPSLSPTEWRDG